MMRRPGPASGPMVNVAEAVVAVDEKPVTAMSSSTMGPPGAGCNTRRPVDPVKPVPIRLTVEDCPGAYPRGDTFVITGRINPPARSTMSRLPGVTIDELDWLLIVTRT